VSNEKNLIVWIDKIILSVYIEWRILRDGQNLGKILILLNRSNISRSYIFLIKEYVYCTMDRQRKMKDRYFNLNSYFTNRDRSIKNVLRRVFRYRSFVVFDNPPIDNKPRLHEYLFFFVWNLLINDYFI
jgi:hypothetical protein